MGSIIIITALVFAVVVEIYTQKTGVVPMPTILRVRRAVLSLLPNKIEGNICELGCGWGGLLLDLSKRYPNNKIIGYELSPLPYWICRFRIWIGRYKNITLYRKNFMGENFNKTGALFCYLTHQHMAQLESKFEKELFKGSVVVSSTFELPNKKSVEDITSTGFWNVQIFKYQF